MRGIHPRSPLNPKWMASAIALCWTISACGDRLSSTAIVPNAELKNVSTTLLFEGNSDTTTLADAAIALAIANGLADTETVSEAATQLLQSDGLEIIALDSVPQPSEIDFARPRGAVDLVEVATILGASKFPCPNPPPSFLAEVVNLLLGNSSELSPSDLQPIPGGLPSDSDNPPLLPKGIDDAIGGCPLGLPVEPGESFEQSFERSVGPEDLSDVYQIAIAQPSLLNVRVTGIATETLQDRIAVQVVRDFNSNGSIDPGDIVARSDQPDLASESVSVPLEAATYFIQVLYPGGQPGLELGTSYRLQLSIRAE
ncbi:MAG: hypothetical protein AAFY15_11230 [Cyanobacteria bacterium J06648_11]